VDFATSTKELFPLPEFGVYISLSIYFVFEDTGKTVGTYPVSEFTAPKDYPIVTEYPRLLPTTLLPLS